MKVPQIQEVNLHTIIENEVTATITKHPAPTTENWDNIGKQAHKLMKVNELLLQKEMKTPGTLPHSLKQLCSDRKKPEYYKVVRKMGVHTANLAHMQTHLTQNREYKTEEKLALRLSALIMQILKTETKTLEEALQDTIRNQDLGSKRTNKNFVNNDLRKLQGEETHKKRRAAKGASFRDKKKIEEKQEKQNSNTHMHKEMRQHDVEAKELTIREILENTTAPNKVKQNRNKSKGEQQKQRSRKLINHARIEANHNDLIVISTGNRKFDCKSKKTDEEWKVQVENMLKEGETWLTATDEANIIQTKSRHKRSEITAYPKGTVSKTAIYMCIPCTVLTGEEKTIVKSHRRKHQATHTCLKTQDVKTQPFPFFSLVQEILTP